MAVQADIMGDVILTVNVKPDGSVQSATVVSGHPMLAQSALNSAQQSQFTCEGCKDAVTPLRLVYTFQVTDAIYCEEPDSTYPRVTQAQNHIIVTGQPVGTCDLGAAISWWVRSWKCLYLWKCSHPRGLNNRHQEPRPNERSADASLS